MDTIAGTSSNDTISGTAQYNAAFDDSLQTFSALDTIDGGAGTDTLSVIDEVEAIAFPSTATVKNVENVVVKGAAAVTADVSGFSGLQMVDVQVAGGNLALTAAAGVAAKVGNADGTVTVTNAETVEVTDASATSTVDVVTGSVTKTVSVKGGSDITVDADGGGANSATLTSATIDGATGAVGLDSDALTSVSLANLVTATKTVTIDNANVLGHELDLTLDGVGYNPTTGAAVADIDIDDATATAVNVTMVSKSNVSLIADVATKLTIAGEGELALNFGAVDELDDTDTVETVTVTGAAGLKADLSGIASLTSVDASATSGANTVTLANTVLTAKGGTGVDKVTYTGALAATAKVDLGGGDDTFTAAAGSTAGAEVDAGAGTDTLALDNATSADTAAEASVFSNFEVLEIGGGQGAYQMDLLGLTAVTITGAALAAAATVDDAAAGTTVAITAAASTDLAAGDLSYALADDTGTADSFELTLNAVDGDDDDNADGVITVASLTADGIETISLVSNVTPDEDDAATPNTNEAVPSADYVNTITSLDGDAAKNVIITGAASIDVTLAAGATEVSKVDATASTGNVTVDQSASTKGVTFLGGSGDDSVTATDNGDLLVGNAGADTFALGAGDDTARYAAGSDSVLVLVDSDSNGVAESYRGIDTITDFTSAADKIELSSALGLATGDARTAVVDKGTTTKAGAFTAAEVAGALQTTIGDGVDFFNDGATDRAVATLTFNDTTGAQGADDSDRIFAFVDANADGNFTAADDIVIELNGASSALLISDITFG